jgi:2'-5' RNA ligase
MERLVVTVGDADGGSSSGTIDFFALVAYLPEPLSEFLSGLRQDLDPRFTGKPHLTILPPRPLTFAWDEAWGELRPIITRCRSFQVTLKDVETFDASKVVYLALCDGYHEVEALHDLLNSGCASCGEAWPFHPHITLAHKSAAENFAEAAECARKRWSEYHGERGFKVDRLTWVKTTIVPGVSDRGTRSLVASDSQWLDLADSELSA